MKIIDYIKKTKGLTNYGLSKKLRQIGVEITTQGVDQYDKGRARSMRLDVLLGFKELSGLSWDKFGKLLEEEFGGFK
jgi:hypothetical protein